MFRKDIIQLAHLPGVEGVPKDVMHSIAFFVYLLLLLRIVND